MTRVARDTVRMKIPYTMARACGRVPKPAWIALAFVSFITLNYNAHIGFYFSFLAFVAMTACLVPVFGKDTVSRAGIRFTPTEALIALPLVAALIVGSYFIITASAGAQGVKFTSHLALGTGRFYVFSVFQTLNEEIIAGALLLFSLRKKFPRIHPLLVSVLVALVFSAAHFVMYRYVFFERSAIGPVALVSLFAVGTVRNNLIFGFGHVLFSWALHLSWNLVFFGGTYTVAASGKVMGQAGLFNIVMGDWPFCVGISIVAALSALLLQARGAGRDDT